MIPHDFYAPWSDEPRLHNRGEGRPYIEPSWQANAAGHQLPVLSTIGRGPKGDSIYVGNYQINDQEYSFDIYSDRNNEVVAHIGPIPTGQTTFSVSQPDNLGDFKFTISTNELVDGEVKKVYHDVTVPQGERGFSLCIAEPTALEQTDRDLFLILLDSVYTVHNSAQVPETDATARVGDCVMWFGSRLDDEEEWIWNTVDLGMIMEITERDTELGPQPFAVIRKYLSFDTIPTDISTWLTEQAEEAVKIIFEENPLVIEHEGIPEVIEISVDPYLTSIANPILTGGGWIKLGDDIVYGDQVAIVYCTAGIETSTTWKDFYYNGMDGPYLAPVKIARIFNLGPAPGWAFASESIPPVSICSVLYEGYNDCNPIFHVGVGATEGGSTIEITAEDGIAVDDPRWDFFDTYTGRFTVTFEVPLVARGIM